MTASSKEPHRPVQVFQYRLPPWLGLLLLVPLGLFFFSIIVVIALAGFTAALILPFFLRRAIRKAQPGEDAIELRPEDYRRID
jgi:hypothetical protein